MKKKKKYIEEEYIERYGVSPRQDSKSSNGSPSNDNKYEDEGDEHDDVKNHMSKTIIEKAVKVLKEDQNLQGFKASYFLTALGTALLRTDEVSSKSKELQDPLAFKVDSLRGQLLEKKLAIKGIGKKSKDSRMSALKEQYEKICEKLGSELTKVERLYDEKERLHKVFKGLFPYTPKKLTPTFIDKYNEVFKENKQVNAVIKDLQDFKLELLRLEKLHELFKNKTKRNLDLLGQKIETLVKILAKEQDLENIISRDNNNFLSTLLKSDVDNQQIKETKTIKDAYKLFGVKNKKN